MVSQLCLMFGSTQNCETLCLGARPRYSLVVDEDVKKPKKQPLQPCSSRLGALSLIAYTLTEYLVCLEGQFIHVHSLLSLPLQVTFSWIDQEHNPNVSSFGHLATQVISTVLRNQCFSFKYVIYPHVKCL